MRVNEVNEVFGVLDINEAQKQILEATPVLERESVHILDSLRRVLAQDIVVTEDFPASDISAMDGYAVRHTSLHSVSKQMPVHLRIIGESPAGRPCGASVRDGEAVRIMTGGLVPEGADTVVRLEDAAEDSGYVICANDPGRGDGIRLRGESLRKGDVVLRAGDLISPVEVGVLATLRRAYVYVHQKPLVAIFSTGDELTDFHDPPSPSKAMCSNLYALAAQVLECGAVPLCLGIVKDDLEAQKSMISDALRADVIITSGGLSKGKYDLVRESFASFGMDMRFSNIFVKPGKPMIFGTIGRKLVFGLPGNPSAVMLSFDQFIKPAFLKLMGHQNAFRGRSHWRDLNGPFSLIDSFAEGNAGNHGHHRASLVPMGRPSPVNGGSGQKQKAPDGYKPGRLERVTH
ncbi:MoeA3: molybdopterin biosynthesis protein [Syntrophobacter sp. SbD1]|nr:MoeA3: molybdopterin biosynthesis protein [Syntrophobacter sp. SbD1]